MRYDVDFFFREDSKLLEKLEKLTKEIKEVIFNFYKQSSVYDIADKNNIVIIEEEDSFLSSEDFFDKIISQYSERCVVIIMTANRDFYNVVRWMRKGATDCIWTGELSEKLLFNSIKGSSDYINSKHSFVTNTNESNIDEQQKLYEAGKITVPSNINWDSISDGVQLEMTIAMVSFFIEKEDVGIYSKSSIEKIFEHIKNEISQIVHYFGGRIWFWNNNSGMLIFHFGDHINNAALSCLYIINKFFLICTEKLKIEKMLKFKISIDTGIGIYYQHDTNHITSELLNFTVHLQQKFTKDNSMFLTKNVFDKLSPRINKFFKENENFENKQIFSY